MDKKIVTVVFVTVFLDLFGFGILIPIQPFFALSFAAKPSVITLLSASYSLMQFVFMPFWGRISDRFGRRPVMLISIATSTLGFFIFAYADSLWMLFLSRMISGLGGANISCAQAIISDISTNKSRTEGMGYVAAATGLGFIFGPALGGILGEHGFMLPALLAGFLSLFNLLLTFLLLKETRQPTPKKTDAPLPLVLDGSKNLTPLYALSFFMIMAFALFEQVIGIYLNAEIITDTSYNASVRFTSIYLVVVALIGAVTQMSILKPLVCRLGEKTTLAMGSFLAAVALFSLPLVATLKNFSLLMIPGAGFGIGIGVSLPCISSIISQSINDEEQGTILGKSQSFSALGRVLGPGACGLLFEYSHHAPFFMAGIVCFLCFFIALRVRFVRPYHEEAWVRG